MEGTELYPTPGTLSAEDSPPNPPGSPLSMTIVTTFTAVQPIKKQRTLFDVGLKTVPKEFLSSSATITASDSILQSSTETGTAEQRATGR